MIYNSYYYFNFRQFYLKYLPVFNRCENKKNENEG
jgi:hypothetical protein